MFLSIALAACGGAFKADRASAVKLNGVWTCETEGPDGMVKVPFMNFNAMDSTVVLRANYSMSHDDTDIILTAYGNWLASPDEVRMAVNAKDIIVQQYAPFSNEKLEALKKDFMSTYGDTISNGEISMKLDRISADSIVLTPKGREQSVWFRHF